MLQIIESLTNDFFFAIALAEEIRKAAAPETIPTDQPVALISNVDLLKILIIPVMLWFMKGLMVYSFERYNLIRHLYSEIELEFDAHKAFRPAFTQWKTENIDITPAIDKSKMKILRYEPHLSYPVYDSSQPAIVKVLWFKETKTIHCLYANFRDIQVLIRNICEGVSMADKEFAVKGTNQFDLIKRETEKVIELINVLQQAGSGRALAHGLFYHKSVYLIPGALMTGLAGFILWVLQTI